MISPGADAFETSSFHQKPFFTIITVTLNDSRGVLRTRSSLERQVYKNWQHIVVDGASVASHQPYLNELSKKDRTLVVSEQDQGIYFAMNKGWQLSQDNTYVLYLNSGDELTTSHALSTISSQIKDFNFPEMLFMQFEQCDFDGSNSICKPIAPNPFNQLFAYGYVSHQGTVMKRSLIDSLGGFDTRFRVAADWDLIVRAMRLETYVKLNYCLVRFYTGGFSTENIAIAHRELKVLRHKYLRLNLKFYILEFLWELVYLRFLKKWTLTRVLILPVYGIAKLAKLLFYPVIESDKFVKKLTSRRASNRHKWGKPLAITYFFIRHLLLFPIIKIRQFLLFPIIKIRQSEISFRNWLHLNLGLQPIFYMDESEKQIEPYG